MDNLRPDCSVPVARMQTNLCNAAILWSYVTMHSIPRLFRFYFDFSAQIQPNEGCNQIFQFVGSGIIPDGATHCLSVYTCDHSEFVLTNIFLKITENINLHKRGIQQPACCELVRLNVSLLNWSHHDNFKNNPQNRLRRGPSWLNIHSVACRGCHPSEFKI